MKKNVLFFISFLLMGIVVKAQAYESTIKYNKADQPALAIEYNYPPDLVEKALISKLESLGVKGKSSKGFRVYSGATIPEINSTAMDYIFSVDKKSRKDKNTSVIHMIVSGSNVVGDNNGSIKENAKVFLSNLKPNIEAGDLEVQIKAQEEVLSKAEKKLKSLQSDQSDLEKKIKKAQEDLSKNGNDQVQQNGEIERQKQVLDALRARKN